MHVYKGEQHGMLWSMGNVFISVRVPVLHLHISSDTRDIHVHTKNSEISSAPLQGLSTSSSCLLKGLSM